MLEINNMEIVENVGMYKNNQYLNPSNYVSIVKVEFKN